MEEKERQLVQTFSVPTPGIGNLLVVLCRNNVANLILYEPCIICNITYVVQQDIQLLLWLNIYSQYV